MHPIEPPLTASSGRSGTSTTFAAASPITVAEAVVESVSHITLTGTVSGDSVASAEGDIRGKFKPGFRPIGAGSTAIKRFFPGEDEDSEGAPPLESALSGSTATPMMRVSSEGTALEPPRIRPSTRPSPEFSRPPSVYDEVPSRSSLPELQSMHEIPPALAPAPATKAAPEIPPSQAGRPSKPEQLYSIVSQVGEGTFGKVYKARNTASGVFVALKRIRMETERDGFPVTAMREIKLLQSLGHENVVRLYEMMVSKGKPYSPPAKPLSNYNFRRKRLHGL
jgi:CTD kinase subunit alpha